MDRAVDAAQRVLEQTPPWIWDGERLPVPIEEIVDSVHGLLVRDVEDMTAAPGAPPLEDGQALSGLLLPARGEIWVNADEARQWPPRRRFTIGHELGHWEMHRDRQQALFCRSTSVAEGTLKARVGPVDIEEEASRFAAELLMPRWLVVREHARCGGDIEALCQAFGASGAAMTRRVGDLFGS